MPVTDLTSPAPAAQLAQDGAVPAVLGVTHSVTGRRWTWRAGSQASHADRMGMAIAQQTGLPEIVGRMLALRHISPDQVESYLRPVMGQMLPDPATLVDMDVTAERMARAIRNGETIGLFGDYDVDGARH